MKLKDTTYDGLKRLAIYVIPALSTFVGTIGVAIQWEYTAICTVIISAFGVFVASCIGMSQKAYNDALKSEYEGTEKE